MSIQDIPDHSSINKGKPYYDLKQIEAIPILDVCSHFGIPVTYRGRKPWCKLRSEEKTASTLLHTEDDGRSKANTFYDFGVHEGGNNITLACMMMGLNRYADADRYQAISYLAEAFHITPKGQVNSLSGNLTDKQYAKIGLYGDLATKNFRFNVEHMDLEKIQEISDKYAIPMNQLKKDRPYTFERLLKRISVPFIEDMRNSLYMDIWLNREAVRKAEATGDLVFQRHDFLQELEELRDVDQIFDRAIIGTKMKSFQHKIYDPKEILKKMDAGEIKPKFGSRTFRQMQKLAKKHQTTVKYRALDARPIYYEGTEIFGQIPYSAFLDRGKAMIGYLESDLDLLRPIFDQYGWKDPSKLHEKLKAAKHRLDHSSTTGNVESAVEPHR